MSKNKSNLRFFLNNILMISLCVFSAFNQTPLFQLSLRACDSVETCEAEQNRIAEEKAKVQQDLDRYNNEQSSLLQQIIALKDQILLTEEQINTKQQLINALFIDIQDREARIIVKEDKVKMSLQSQQKQQNSNLFLTLLLSSKSLSELMTRAQALDTYNKYEMALIDDLAAEKDQLEVEKTNNETVKTELEQTKTELQELQAAQENRIKELQALEATAHATLDDLVMSEEEINKQLAIISGGVPPSNGWYIPAATGILTCTIGCYPGHIGVDFGMATGTAVYAVTSGTVVYTQYSNANTGYGNMITIAHNVQGVPHISIYGHLSAIYVSEGDVVTGGQTIGLSGNTGASTGPHLHLEIVANVNTFVDKSTRIANLVNPLSVLPKPSNGWNW